MSATGTIKFNNTGQAIDQTVSITPPGGAPADPSGCNVADGSAAFETTSLTVDIAGQRLTGAAAFTSTRSVPAPTPVVDVTFTNVDLRLADGLVVVNDANGVLRFGARRRDRQAGCPLTVTVAAISMTIPGLELHGRHGDDHDRHDRRDTVGRRLGHGRSTDRRPACR